MGRFVVTIAVAATLVAGGTAAIAKTHHHRSHHHLRHTGVAEHSAISCETVRTYVSQIGMEAARAMARANGMTMGQERQARRCLARRD
jgi:hypothetical protein